MAFEVEHIPCIGLPAQQHLLEGSIPIGASRADQGVVPVGGQEGHDGTKEEDGKVHLAGWRCGGLRRWRRAHVFYVCTG